MKEVVALVFAFALGFLLALEMVGYGVPYGLKQCVRLAKYRSGRCRCSLCRPE